MLTSEGDDDVTEEDAAEETGSKKDLEDEFAYQERNEPTDPAEATSSIVEKKQYIK